MQRVGVQTAAEGGLLERDGDLRRLARVVRAASEGESSVSVIAAAAGMGKTELLEAVVADAAVSGVAVLLARASELERDFAFGVVRQLLEPRVLRTAEDERRQLLSGAARHAAAALDLDPDGTPDRDVHTTLHGLYWLLANLSAESPLVVAVDDLQWADEPSLRWLAHVVRRLEGLPVAVVVTLRIEQAYEQRHAAIDEVLARTRSLRIEPAPLSVEAVATLIERELGRPGDPAFAAACHVHTAGNPFLLSELVNELAAEGVAPHPVNVPALERIVPQRVGDTINRHLSRVSTEARAVAEAVAVLGDAGDLGAAAELVGMEPERASHAAGELLEAAILAQASPPRFRHPLLRAAVDAAAPAPERAARHGRAARLLADRGAPPARVATHLLAGPPGTGDPWVVDQLRAAARSARSQGVAWRAAILLRRALAEPPQPELRAAVLRELGTAELVSLDAAMTAHLEDALELERDPGARAEIAVGLGLAYYVAGQHAEAVEALLAAIEQTGDRHELREQRLRLEAMLALAGRYDLATEGRVKGRIERLAEGLAGDTPGERLVRMEAARQAPSRTAAELFAATELEEATIGLLPWPDPTEGVGTTAMYLHAGRPDAAAALSKRLLSRAGDEGSRSRHAMALACRAAVELDVGDLRAAEADFDSSLHAMAEVDADRPLRTTAGFLAQTLARRGSIERAGEVLADHELDADLPEQMLFNPPLFCRGDVRLAQRRFDDAEADFRELGRRHERWGMARPSPPWRSACAHALIGQGRAEEARELALEELELVRRWDTSKAIAYTTRALALTYEGERQIEGLREAVDLLEQKPWRFDRALARLDLGAALRRTGQRRAGREALAQAMDEAHACGADALAERAADELRASGARPRRRAVSGVDALTPSERRVAVLAAEGRTNRDIAQELFVTTATVETHLTRAYRKLDIPGRAALSEALDG